MEFSQHSSFPETSTRKCCIHITENVSPLSEIKLFTDKTLKKCRIILEARKKFCMQYNSINLPLSLNTFDGYHTACYRKFTAVKKGRLREAQIESFKVLTASCTRTSQDVFSPNVNNNKVTRSRNKLSLKNSRTGIFQQICLFCNRSAIYHKKKKIGLIACTTKVFESKIKQYALILKDEQMLSKIIDTDFVAKEVHYHGVCRIKYQKQASLCTKKEHGNTSAGQLNRKCHVDTMNDVNHFVDNNILNKSDAFFLKDVYDMYLQIYLEYANERLQEPIVTFTATHLKEKLNRLYKNRLLFSRYKREVLIYPREMQYECAVEICVSKKRTLERDMQRIAFRLRKDIIASKKAVLPTKLTVKDVLEGECDIPESVRKFFEYLLSGPRCRRNKFSETIKVDSLSQDTIYSVTSGRTKPSKHMLLGMAIKSLTGSKKVLNILNKLGHCASYSVIEELETELTYSSLENSNFIADDVVKSPTMGTAVAFDNYDRFVETVNGKNTLHDTVGVLYQNKSENSAAIDKFANNTTMASNSKKRRRAFLLMDRGIEPYHKKPKLESTLAISVDNISSKPANLHFVRRLDNLWMMSLALLDSNRIPFWTGWNNFRIQDDLPQQKIWYLPSINASPTSLSVVVETLKRAQAIAEECHQPYISVTYDLAIAKLAFQIQHAESPRYDNIFIQLGPFHIELSFFKALGKYIEESGGPAILTDSEILAQGSLKGFINGTHYNRCKRIHVLFATALQILHFKEFLITKEYVMSDIIKELQDLQATNNVQDEPSDVLQLVLTDYNDYCEQTVAGSHATAKYWMNYINLVKLYLEFSRSIRTSDFHLYVHCLPQIASLMFSMNHQNYSRWILKYYSNLLNIDKSHPGFKEILINGGFSIRRTNKTFSRTPIDLTLEQTINADAANKLTGISNFTNSISARQRWAVSHALRTTLVTHMLEKLDLTRTDDTTNSLRPHVVKRDNSVIEELIRCIQNNINPFSGELKQECLFNLSTGKSASQKTKDFLLNVMSIGCTLRDKFIHECATDPLRFEARINKQEVHTFASENRNLVRKSDGKLTQVKMDRNLLGRILFLSMENKLDIMHILSFPLTPVPLSLCHIDGTMLKTDKSSLLKLLEKRSSNIVPTSPDCTIIDGFFFLHLLGEVPVTFGKISQYILSKICKCRGDRIDIIFDKFITPSIKDSERDRRANLLDRAGEFEILGPEQRRPADFTKALRNDNFKRSLTKFLCNDWQNDAYAPILNNKRLYVNYEDTCYEFYCRNGSMFRKEYDRLTCLHEEADTRIVYHLSQLTTATQVVVRTSDTDVLIIILGSQHKFPENLSIWLEVGVCSKNSLRYIHVNSLAVSLGSNLCKALPAFHCLTGCDYTAAFCRKGKVRPFSILEKDEGIQKVFSSFGSNPELSDEQIRGVEKFVCKMYGRNNMTNINEVRFDIFVTSLKSNDTNKPMNGLRNFDCSMLPPCKDVLLNKVKRLNQVCSVWNNADKRLPAFYNPLQHGWILVNGRFQHQWFEGPQTPTSLEEITATGSNELSETSDEEELHLSSSDEDA